MKPILYEQTKDSFDASLDHAVYFVWHGNQSVQNTIKIWNNKTLELVYEHTQITQTLSHIIPKNTLTNGTTYRITVYVTDVENKNSEEADPVIYTCYSTPLLQVNLAENQIIKNSSYNLNITYSQAEGEELQEYCVELYNALQNKIWSTNVLYTLEDIMLTGLEDSHTYMLKVTGKTIHDMYVETPYINFSVTYDKKKDFAICFPVNVPDIAAIQIRSNIIVIEGECTIDPPVYTRDITCLDVTEGKVFYNKDLSFNGNWLADLRFYITEKSLNKKVFCMNNGEDIDLDIYLYSRYVNKKTMYYFELKCIHGWYTYCLQSPCIKNLNSEIRIILIYKDNRFSIYLEQKEES